MQSQLIAPMMQSSSEAGPIYFRQLKLDYEAKLINETQYENLNALFSAGYLNYEMNKSVVYKKASLDECKIELDLIMRHVWPVPIVQVPKLSYLERVTQIENPLHRSLMTTLFYDGFRKFNTNFCVVRNDTSGNIDKIKEELYGEDGDDE